MPKMKSHRGAAKRFKKTGTGKVIRRHSFGRHNLSKKSSGRKRRLGGETVVVGEEAKHLFRMLPH